MAVSLFLRPFILYNKRMRKDTLCIILLLLVTLLINLAVGTVRCHLSTIKPLTIDLCKGIYKRDCNTSLAFDASLVYISMPFLSFCIAIIFGRDLQSRILACFLVNCLWLAAVVLTVSIFAIPIVYTWERVFITYELIYTKQIVFILIMILIDAFAFFLGDLARESIQYFVRR